MKSKLILCLALVLSGMIFYSFATLNAYGSTVEIQINHANLKTDYSFLKINTSRVLFTNNPVLYFTVTVIPKDKRQQADNFEGTLTINDPSIKDSHTVIGYTSVNARKLPDGKIMFSFGIAVKYVETSEFRVEESYGKFGDAPVDYIFNLKEFADEK
jgi:hypothetical protein